ncbi:hypothetical protein SS50377_21238 [Spironucleus salmonicida]|uniref:Cyclin n=1 Tax=Spironucleus salmonicida TaxID=348837 RepID=V6LHG6_9EUKA|nr:hypothetical protein SS50377_21238 [Spironucleus salmonicida]|eukprot:EST44010.1 Hypothetical protein SS50377_16319 [Spironucleus salmonicida]
MLKTTHKLARTICLFLSQDASKIPVKSLLDQPNQPRFDHFQVHQMLQTIAFSVPVIPEAYVAAIEELQRFRVRVPLQHGNCKSAVLVSLVIACKLVDDDFVLKKSKCMYKNYQILEREFCKIVGYQTFVDQAQYNSAYSLYNSE